MRPPLVDHVALTVRDLPAMTTFYREALGLTPLGGDSGTQRLGAGGRMLLELRGDRAARPRDPRQAGLFHTAFLLPERADLARWLRHAAEARVQLTGASDHGVSEAIYLDDPEGNGIEVYWDRPADEWNRDRDRVEMFTHRLDLDNLLTLADAPWSAAPEGSSIGHVHLQVGDLDRAHDFLSGDLGLTRTFDARGAAWYGWNGYHHHLAGNVWNSRGAGPRDEAMMGLAEIVIQDPDRAGQAIADPWGTRFRFL